MCRLTKNNVVDIKKMLISFLFYSYLQCDSTFLLVIAINMHTKYGVIRTYGDKVMLRTRNAL